MNDRDVDELLKSLGVRDLNKVRLDDINYLKQVCKATIILTVLILCIFIYSSILSKYLPDTGNVILDWIKYDQYFCYLLPLLVLPTLAVVYLSWLSLSLFNHN